MTPEKAEQYGRPRLDYLFTQQQLGVGRTVVDTAAFKSSAILNWNHFQIEVFHATGGKVGVPSLNIENAVELGHGFEVKQTGQLYWLYRANDILWENSLDLTKHVSTHLFVTLRHEYRKDYPVRDATPLDRLRLLFGANY